MEEERFRWYRRLAGVLAARLPEAKLDDVADPRARGGRRWKKLGVLLGAVVVGICAGMKSLAQLENMTAEMGRPLLANVYLHPVNEEMVRAGHQWTRYADDGDDGHGGSVIEVPSAQLGFVFPKGTSTPRAIYARWAKKK